MEKATWVEMLNDEQLYYKQNLAALDKLRSACQALDDAGIPPEGSLYQDSITIRKATEDYIPKLVKIKTGPVTKYFHEWTGELGYSTEIGEVTVYVVPDAEKYICKVRKDITIKTIPKEEKTVKFFLEGDCDPLFFEEASQTEVQE